MYGILFVHMLTLLIENFDPVSWHNSGPVTVYILLMGHKQFQCALYEYMHVHAVSYTNTGLPSDHIIQTSGEMMHKQTTVSASTG